MKHLALVIPAILALVLISESENSNRERPAANIPFKLRYRNWVPPGVKNIWNGSCVIAATCDSLVWQGKPEVAARLRRKYAGGQCPSEWNATLKREHIRYAYTFDRQDVEFLERACRTRRGCCVAMDKQAHMVYLVDLTSTQACILGTNFPEKYVWMDREKFLQDWFTSNSWAFTPVYTPTSPRPK